MKERRQEKAAVLDAYCADPFRYRRGAFSHGANDSQKGIGLVMLVLIGVAPAGFVVNIVNATGCEITRTRDAINNVEAYLAASCAAENKRPGLIS